MKFSFVRPKLSKIIQFFSKINLEVSLDKTESPQILKWFLYNDTSTAWLHGQMNSQLPSCLGLALQCWLFFKRQFMYIQTCLIEFYHDTQFLSRCKNNNFITTFELTFLPSYHFRRGGIFSKWRKITLTLFCFNDYLLT